MPCTTILVGKKASYDGSTLMARNEDCGPEKFKPKKFVVVNPEEPAAALCKCAFRRDDRSAGKSDALHRHAQCAGGCRYLGRGGRERL